MPRVSVRNSDRKPMRPRAGMRNSRRTRPWPLFAILVMALAGAELLGHDADEIFGAVDDQTFPSARRLFRRGPW